MAVYTCPSCGKRMERDFMLITQHTEQHVIDELKKIHPEWTTQEGYCPKCLDYFKRLMKGQAGEPRDRKKISDAGELGPLSRKSVKIIIISLLFVLAAIFIFYLIF